MNSVITPSPPYYLVVFTYTRANDDVGFDETSDLVSELVKHQLGFIGVEHVQGDLNIMVSYWENAEAIMAWRKHVDHLMVQKAGRDLWFKEYKIRVGKVERDYEYGKTK